MPFSYKYLLIWVAVVALVTFTLWQGRFLRGVTIVDQFEKTVDEGTSNVLGGTATIEEMQRIEYSYEDPKLDETARAALGPVPPFVRAVLSGVSTEERARLEYIVGELQNAPYSARLWLEMGLYRKELGDYDGAREAWEFARKIQPKNAVIIDNLGVLYGYYLKDGLKSEESFRAAIALEPQNIHLHLRLFELYRDVLADQKKARASVEEALRDNPGNGQLTALLKEITEGGM